MFNKLDIAASLCSFLYFIFFITSLGCLISGQCSEQGNTGVTSMKIITLILPMVFFAKLLYDATIGEQNNYSMHRFQLGILLAYFFIVFLFMCAQVDNNTEAAKNINTLALYILPIFIIASFYSTYELWKTGGKTRSLLYLNLTLAVLYYSLFYFSLEFNGSVFGDFGGNALNSILIAISIILVFLFLYRACSVYVEKYPDQKQKHKYIKGFAKWYVDIFKVFEKTKSV